MKLPPLREAMRFFERSYLILALQEHEGKAAKTRCAEALGVTRKSLWERSRELGIPTDPRKIGPGDLAPARLVVSLLTAGQPQESSGALDESRVRSLIAEELLELERRIRELERGRDPTGEPS